MVVTKVTWLGFMRLGPHTILLKAAWAASIRPGLVPHALMKAVYAAVVSFTFLLSSSCIATSARGLESFSPCRIAIFYLIRHQRHGEDLADFGSDLSQQSLKKACNSLSSLS